MLHARKKVIAVIVSLAALAACAPVVSELKAARHPHVDVLHEQLSQSIRSFGFAHGIRSVREDAREIDTIVVAIPLDSLKRQHVGLHHMLFNVARLCARPEHAKLFIELELNAGDESDRAYMRGIVEPIVSGVSNVKLVSQRDDVNDLVITIWSTPVNPAAAKPSRAAAR